MIAHASHEVIEWKGLRIPRLKVHEIHSAILYLLRILNRADEITGDEKTQAVELTYHLRHALYDISTEAFLHAFEASLALIRFLADSNKINRCSTEDHLIAIRTILSLDEFANQASHAVLGQDHLLPSGGNQ